MGQRHTLSRLFTLLNFEGQPSSRYASSVPSFITSYKRSWHLTHLAHLAHTAPFFLEFRTKTAMFINTNPPSPSRSFLVRATPAAPSGRPTIRRPRKTPLAWSLSRSLARPPSRRCPSRLFLFTCLQPTQTDGIRGREEIERLSSSLS